MLNICFHIAFPNACFAFGLPSCQSRQKKSQSTCCSSVPCAPQTSLIEVQFAHFDRIYQDQTCAGEIDDQPPQEVIGFIPLAASAESAAKEQGCTTNESYISRWVSLQSVVSNMNMPKQIGIGSYPFLYLCGSILSHVYEPCICTIRSHTQKTQA